MAHDEFDHGSLADVGGVLVGHHQRTGRGWQTGTTVVLVPDGAVAAVDVRGGGPGTRETDALDPRNLVDRIHAVCLTGGSAYGLAAADGVVETLERRGLGVPVGPDPGAVVPVVPAAVIFDLARGGAFGHRPDADFGRRATKAAGRRPKRGSVGAGSGARAGGIQGGVGMASTIVELGGSDASDGSATTVTVAAVAVVNASGSLLDPATGAPWQPVRGLRRPSRDDRERLAAAVLAASTPPLNTTIGVVATDAALTRPETGRLAQSSHDGLARAIRPAHSLMDGDTVFGLSTGTCPLGVEVTGIERTPDSRATQLNRVFAAAADVFAMACIDAVVTATGLGSAPAYRDLCPSAWPR